MGVYNVFKYLNFCEPNVIENRYNITYSLYLRYVSL